MFGMSFAFACRTGFLCPFHAQHWTQDLAASYGGFCMICSRMTKCADGLVTNNSELTFLKPLVIPGNFSGL